jgi:hypothetical protein
MRLLAAALLSLTAAAARAQGEDLFPTQPRSYQSRLLPPGGMDLRLGGGVDVLIARGEAILGLDRAVVEWAGGVLAIGAEIAVGRCLGACGRISAELVLSRTLISPMARLLYQFELAGNAENLRDVGFYGLFIAGASLPSASPTSSEAWATCTA